MKVSDGKGGSIDVPEPDDDPAMLSSLYSGYAMYEVWRKIVLSSCMEVIRASAVLSKQKVTEKRLESLAHLHPSYLQCLETHLRGRVAYERNVKDSGRY